MAIETGMYNALLKQPEFESPLNALAKMAQLQHYNDQSKVAGVELQAKQRDLGATNALADAWKSSIRPDGTTDENKLFSNLGASGYGDKIPTVQKTLLDNRKLKGEVSSKDLENAHKGIDYSLKAIGGLVSLGPEVTLDHVTNTVQDGLINGAYTEQQAKTLLQRAAEANQTGKLQQWVRTSAAKTLSAKDQLDEFSAKYSPVDNGGSISMVNTNPNAAGVPVGTVGTTVQKTLTPEQTAELPFKQAKESREATEFKDKQAAQNAGFEGSLGQSNRALDTLDRLAKHPGLSKSVGVNSAFPTMPGSDAANFEAELESLKSQTFLPAVQSLKGMGALSDAEGAKITASIGALSPKMSEGEFRASLDRIRSDIQAGRERVSKQSGIAPPARDPANGKPASQSAPAISQDNRAAGIRAQYQAGKITRDQAKAALAQLGYK